MSLLVALAWEAPDIMVTSATENSIKTVLELDLASYSDISRVLEENLDVYATKAFQDQIQSFVDRGLEQVGLKREDVVLGTAGDNALLVFDDAIVMHRFAEAMQQAVASHNRERTVDSAKRCFRMGAATGPVLLLQAERRIVGTTVARAVRLEAAAKVGQILVDAATYELFPDTFKALYGEEEEIRGKREERFLARRCTFVPTPELAQPAPATKARSWVVAGAVLLMLCAAVVAYVLNNRERGSDSTVFKETAKDKAVGATADSKRESERHKIQRIAHSEIREAVENILHPFEILCENAEYGPAKVPFRDPTEFYCSPDYMASALKSAAFVKAWAHYKMQANPTYPDVALPWWRFFSDNAKRNSALLDSIVQKYGTHLEAETLSAIHDLQKDDFFKLRLLMLGELIDLNGNMPISHAFESPRRQGDVGELSEYRMYEAFVDKIAALMRRVSDGKTHWSEAGK